jgi:SAM-dependent methyltransferase
MSSPKLIKTYDDLYAEEEISFSEMPKKFPVHRNEALVMLANSGKRVLEIGCGSGNVLYNLRNNFHELYGVELSNERADKLRRLARKHEFNCQIISGNIEEKLDFPDRFFDVILWADVIEHVIDLWSAMSEIKRLLADRGRLVTCTPNVAELRRRLTLLRGRFPSTSGQDEGLLVRPNELFDGGHLHYFTFSSLAKLYRKYGIEPDRYLGFGKLGRFHNFYPSLFSSVICIAGGKIA